MAINGNSLEMMCGLCRRRVLKYNESEIIADEKVSGIVREARGHVPHL